MEEKDKDLEKEEGTGEEVLEEGGGLFEGTHKPFRFEEEGYWEGASGEESETEGRVAWLRRTLGEILELMGIKAHVEAQEGEGRILLEIKGDGGGLIIGKHGQTLDALQYIMNKIAAHRYRDRELKEKLVLDTENYRGRRIAALENMALRMREKVKNSKRAVTIGPLNPQDRRIIHITLSGDEDVRTESKGEGFYKTLVIAPKSGEGRG